LVDLANAKSGSHCNSLLRWER